MRTKLQPGDAVHVYDDAEFGDLYYGDWTEDGERRICRPDRAAIIELVTDYGRRYTLAYSFGEDFGAAEEMVDRILAAGTVNLDRWVRGRNVYGSDAYQNEGDEAAADAWERDTEASGGYCDGNGVGRRETFTAELRRARAA